ncbi:dynamin family protein [Jannaschia sp.]|nr:dynamin family protein [Jannaschia sp.]
MTAVTQLAAWHGARPVLALMGEFSAGKSTLLNLLLGHVVLPTRATATSMPAVWLTHGTTRTVTGLRPDGSCETLDTAALAHGGFDDFLALRITDPAPMLERCDVLDTPGISDPRLPQGRIQMLAAHVDMVVWCSPATQLWRQSEKAMWSALPHDLRARSVLAVTRADVLSERDLTKVLARATRETARLFRAICPLAAPLALSGDAQSWQTSGAAILMEEIASSLSMVPQAEITSAPDSQPIDLFASLEKLSAALADVSPSTAIGQSPPIPKRQGRSLCCGTC